MDADLFFLSLGGLRLTRACVDEMTVEERQDHVHELIEHLKERKRRQQGG